MFESNTRCIKQWELHFIFKFWINLCREWVISMSHFSFRYNTVMTSSYTHGMGKRRILPSKCILCFFFFFVGLWLHSWVSTFPTYSLDITGNLEGITVLGKHHPPGLPSLWWSPSLHCGLFQERTRWPVSPWALLKFLLRTWWFSCMQSSGKYVSSLHP